MASAWSGSIKDPDLQTKREADMIFRLLTLIGLLLFSDATSAPAQHAHSGSYGSSSLGDWIQLGQPVSSGGLQVHFRMSATGSRFLKGVSPGELELGFRLDWEDGKGPAIGLEPFAWIARATDSSGAWDAQSCQEAVSRMARGGMESEEAIALNKMQILTLNQDQSLSVINPRVSLATANIESIIPLGGRPVEALVDERRGLLFMLLEKTRTPFGPGSSEAIPAAVGAGGEKGELAVFDLQGNRIRGRLELKGLPHKFFADKELELLWITSSSGEVTLVESQGLRIIRSFRWGQGPVEAQFDPSGTRVFLASSTETHLKVMDARRGGLLGNIDVPREGLKLASSAHTGRTYAVDSKGGGVLVLDSSTLMVLGTIALAPGVASVKISPDGRFLLALFPEKRALAVVDLERGAVVQRGRIGQGPEQLEFTQHYGYVHHPKSAQITIFRQADLGNGPELPVLEIPVGSNSDEMIPKASNLNKMAIMHGHGGALIAHGGGPHDLPLYGGHDGSHERTQAPDISTPWYSHLSPSNAGRPRARAVQSPGQPEPGRSISGAFPPAIPKGICLLRSGGGGDRGHGEAAGSKNSSCGKTGETLSGFPRSGARSL